MRDDFNKVIHEGYRSGKANSIKNNKPHRAKRQANKAEKSNDKELFLKTESSARRRRYGWDCKRVTHNYGPKKKFLASRVGEAWDEVHSELCKAGVQKDFEYLVELTYIGKDKDGYPINNCNELIHRSFYVDAAGVLRKTPQLKRRNALSKEIWYIQIKREWYGRRTDGLWYRLCLKPVPEPNWQWVAVPYRLDKTMMIRRNLADVSYDMWLCRTIYRASEALFDGWYCERYTQVNKKELRQIKKALL